MSDSSFQSDGATAKRKPVRKRVAPGVFKRTTSDGRTRYEISFLDRDGRQRWETVGDDLEEAKRRRHALHAKPLELRKAPAREVYEDVAEAWFEVKAPKLRPRTRDYYRDALDLVLLPRFGRCRVALIDADAVTSLTRDLEREGLHAVDPARPVRPLGYSSVSNYLKPLQQSLAFAARRGWIPVSPFSILTADDRPTRNGERKKAHEWTSDELTALLAASRRLAVRKVAPEARPNDFSTLLLVTATLGLRLGEVLGLRWSDFEKGEDADSALLHVERQWLRSGEAGPVKTRAGVRTLAVPSDLREELIGLRLRSRYSADEHPIFASRQGTPLQHRNVTRRGFEAARDEAKLDGSLSFHDLRHAAASRLIASGLDDAMVADQIGHGDTAITRKVYAHVYDRREKMDAVRAALAGALAPRSGGGVAEVE
jgi:integrase